MEYLGTVAGVEQGVSNYTVHSSWQPVGAVVLDSREAKARYVCTM